MEESGNGKGSFFACYLLTSLNPRYKGCHYIGFTVNPRRRIRQHNGELTSGAWRTHRKRPWDMVLCVYGFSSQVEALQFEWAWQHPIKSLAVKEAAARIPSSVRGLKKQFYLLFTMLNCDKWSSMDLNVQFLSSKYIDYRKGCPGLPPHMGLSIAPVDTLPMNVEEADSELDADVEKERSLEPVDTLPMNVEEADSELNADVVKERSLEQPRFSDIEQDDWDPPTDWRREEIVSRPISFDSPDVSVIGEAVGNTRQAVDFPASDDYTIRKALVGDDVSFPIRYRQVPASPVEASISVGSGCILETSPRILNCCSKNMVIQDARGQSKTKVKSPSEVSDSGDVERRSNCHGYDWLENLPIESGASEMSSMSPFSALLEQYSVKPPSSIVKRCLEQKANAHIPIHSDSSVSIRNLSSDGFPENLPRTPPCRSRVVVVIPDYTPNVSSREVIDLTDSPF